MSFSPWIHQCVVPCPTCLRRPGPLVIQLFEWDGRSLILLLIPIWILPDLCFSLRTEVRSKKGKSLLREMYTIHPHSPLQSYFFLVKLEMFTCNINQSQDFKNSRSCLRAPSALLTQFLQICDWLRDIREPPLLLLCSSGRESNFPKLPLNYYYELLHCTDYNHCNTGSSSAAVNYSNWICASILGYIAWLQAGW